MMKIRIHKPIYGVPITFLDKYCPDQFEIIWRGGDIDWCEKECNFYTPPTTEKAEYYKNKIKLGEYRIRIFWIKVEMLL